MTSTTSQTPFPTSWDVFLSFCGQDTRYKFTSHLYAALDNHGIRSFMDDPELRSGEIISNALLEVIRKSKTYIVVISENYASSRWCLDELVEILNCFETMQRLVIPVFYNIDPSIVRNQIGDFKEAFVKHESRFVDDVETVNKWRLALKKVADFSGKHVSAKRSEADIINDIVDTILREINPKALDAAKYPVGLDSRVKATTALLSSGTESVIKFGIYGMGGAGKTTFAKALYNELMLGSFKASCFLANVREVSGTLQGLVSLQQQLIDDVLKSKSVVKVRNVDQGTRLIEARICSTKVLVVVDDVDHHKQFEYLVGPFASGSVVIVTTRDEQILDTIEVEPRFRYKVKELDDVESLALFKRHAFGDATPNDTFEVLSKDIIRHAGGLPLALEVFGSNLLKQSEAGWRWYTDKLKRFPVDDVERKLVISFDALKLVHPQLQDIFLDIACFFIGWKQKVVVEIMETSYTFVNHNIDILKKRCLLTINKKDKLGMHDLLRDMGRQIARNNSPDEPEKHSRLWVSKDIREVLNKYKGTKAIEGIFLKEDKFMDEYNEALFEVETFKRMSKLRFLFLEDVHLTGSFEETFEDLRWLCWIDCPLKCLPSKFHPQKLVILELPYSKLRTMWELNMVSGVFNKLKTLDMRHSRNLTTTPDFTKLPCLQTINLEGCKNLEEVHTSIGRLVRLESLALHDCVKLRSLPDSICNLRALKVLSINSCSSLEALPIDLGNIESLEELNAEKLNVSKLPNSIGHLRKLLKLTLNNSTKLKTLPDSICNLRALEVLLITNCINLVSLPMDLGNIKSLKELNAERLNVSKLPHSIGHLSKLVELKLTNSENLETLPNTIGNLRSLENLNISGCKKLEILPDQLWKLLRLRELNAGGAVLLKMLPDIEFSQIRLPLENLNLRDSILTALPSGFSQLSNLEYLDLEDCCHLLSIVELPSSLKWIKAKGCTFLERLPNLSNLKLLEDLDLTDCSGLTGIFVLEELTSLKALKLTGCSGLTEIQGLEKLISISTLYLDGCGTGLWAYSFTKRFFQIYSGFGHLITMNIGKADFPDWISLSTNLESCHPDTTDIRATFYLILSLDLPPNVSHNYLGLVLYFKFGKRGSAYKITVKNATGDIIWYKYRCFDHYQENDSAIVVGPNSVFSFRDGDSRIELASNTQVLGFHLLYKPEINIIMDEERSYPFKRLKHLESDNN